MANTQVQREIEVIEEGYEQKGLELALILRQVQEGGELKSGVDKDLMVR